jgi:phosphoglycerate dehydrogenase-like enzyme
VQTGKRLVVLTVRVSDKAIQNLNNEFPRFEFRKTASKAEALSMVEDAEILVSLAPSSEIISSANGCKWLQVLTAGVEDYLAMNEIRNKQDLLLTNASGIHAIPISEHIFAMILALTRDIKKAIINQQDKIWTGLENTKPSMIELCGKNLLLVGLGSIGLATAKKGKAFGMKCIAVKNDILKEPKDPKYSNYVEEIHGPEELAKLIPLADFIVDSLPLTERTENMFDAKLFSKVKEGAFFVNVGRGKTVVERDLVEALRSGRLAGGGLDVFETEPLPKDSELWEMTNVIVSPHISGWSEDYLERALEIFKENLRRYIKGERLINLVDRKVGY